MEYNIKLFAHLSDWNNCDRSVVREEYRESGVIYYAGRPQSQRIHQYDGIRRASTFAGHAGNR